MREFSLGSAAPRIEDPQLLRGHGRYTDDITLPGQARLYLLRSPHAAARIAGIDVSAAQQAPGVIAVLTGADLDADGIGGIPSRVRRNRRDGSPSPAPLFRALARDHVHHVGAPVAAVIAETLAAAKDAAELIVMDYDMLPSVTDVAAAVEPGAPVVWHDTQDNICFYQEVGDKAATDAAFTRAKHVVSHRFRISRVAANPLEPRMALGCYEERGGRYTLYTSSQTPHLVRQELAESVFKLPATQFHIISPDVGGAFGMKGGLYPEQVLVLWAARRAGRPVKWTGERSESFTSDFHARDNVSDVSMALDEHGKFLGLRVNTLASLGAYISANGALTPLNNVGGLAGTYATPHIHVAVTGVFTNNNPTAPYRGAGRPEASYCIESIIDIAARELGIDRIALRRRNMIPASAMPFKTGLTYTYDSGEFEQVMDAALELGEWKAAQERQKQARRDGKLYGLGVSSVIEIAGGPADRPMEEAAEIRFDPSGGATLFIGSHNHGQGHETSFRQIVKHALGLPPERVRVVFGDTDKVFHGRGTFGSRSMVAGGSAVMRAAGKIIERGKTIAGHLLEAAAGDIEFKDGTFIVAGTDRAIGLAEVAKTSFNVRALPRDWELGLDANAIVIPKGATFPNGFHVCEIAIEPETGQWQIMRYTVVDDVGVTVNPLLLKGQIHGGVAQGAGQALFERVVYDRDGGQLLSGSFMDYRMPRAHDFPFFAVGSYDVPTKSNPLGVKGAGEAGCVGALPAVMSAVNDALAPLGIRYFEMPATPDRLWRAIRDARAKTE